jgi:hypothetical protein
MMSKGRGRRRLWEGDGEGEVEDAHLHTPVVVGLDAAALCGRGGAGCGAALRSCCVGGWVEPLNPLLRWFLILGTTSEPPVSSWVAVAGLLPSLPPPASGRRERKKCERVGKANRPRVLPCSRVQIAGGLDGFMGSIRPWVGSGPNRTHPRLNHD